MHPADQQQDDYPPGVPTYEDVTDQQHTQPYPPPPGEYVRQPRPAPRRPRRPRAEALGPYIVALVAALVAVGCIQQLSSKPSMQLVQSTAHSQASQIGTLRSQLASAQKAARTSQAQLDKLAGELAALTAYSKECTIPVQGPNGPAQAYFRCSYQHQAELTAVGAGS